MLWYEGLYDCDELMLEFVEVDECFNNMDERKGSLLD